jgi:RNA polymerase sigma-70 factor (ECF subfamily)
MTAPIVVHEMLAEGRLRWPSVHVTLEEYQRRCEMIRGERALAALREHAADIYLCCACVQQDPSAQRIFERDADPVVRGAIARVYRETEFVRETLQEFWEKLLSGPNAKVNEYGARGPLQAWLRVAAARLAIDRRRAHQAMADRETDIGELLVDQSFGPEATLIRTRFYTPFRDALRDAIAQLPSKQRNLLRMHVQGHCSIDQIGRAYGVHRATAARWLEGIKAIIVQSVRSRFQLIGPRLTNSEFASVARIVGGELDLGLSALPTNETSEHWSSIG